MIPALTWNDTTQIGRYTIKPVRLKGMDLFGLYINEKLFATRLNRSHAVTQAYKLEGQMARIDAAEILALISHIEVLPHRKDV